MSEDLFFESLQTMLRGRLDEIASEEIEAATARIRARIGEEVDRLALSLLAEYEVSSRTDRLVITVKKT